jgi:hypothetical protein
MQHGDKAAEAPDQEMAHSDPHSDSITHFTAVRANSTCRSESTIHRISETGDLFIDQI